MRTIKILLIIFLLFSTTYAVQAEQNKLSCNIYLGDIDNDGTDDFIKIINKNSIRIFKSDFEVTPITIKSLCLNANISKVMIGNFIGQGNILMIFLENDEIHYYDYNENRKELLKISQQPNFILYSQEDVIVGDFDGDKIDEILLHNPKTGKVSFHEFNSRNRRLVSVPKTKIRLGNLENFNFIGKKILAGEFNGNTNHTDLLIINYEDKRIHRYSGVLHEGVNEFWDHFNAYNNLISTENNITIANINGDLTDDILIRNSKTGKYFFYFPNEYLPNGLKPITNIDSGQLPKETGDVTLIKHKNKNKTRDNIISIRNNWITLTGAATDREKLTYWWAYRSDKLCVPENLSPDYIITKAEWEGAFRAFLSSSRLRLNNFTPQKGRYRRDEFEFYKPDDSYLFLNGENYPLNIGLPIRTGPNNMYKMYINDWNSQNMNIKGKPDNILELNIIMEDNGSEVVGMCYNNFFCGFSPAPKFDYSNSQVIIDIELLINNGRLDYQTESSFSADVKESGPCVNNFFAMFCPSDRNSIIKTNLEAQINNQVNTSSFKYELIEILNRLISAKGINLREFKTILVGTNENILFFK